jgi:hypothetical protein
MMIDRGTASTHAAAAGPECRVLRAMFQTRTIRRGASKMTINMTIKDRHWRSIRPKAMNMTMPVIIPTSSAAVIISIAPSRQTMGRS